MNDGAVLNYDLEDNVNGELDVPRGRRSPLLSPFRTLSPSLRDVCPCRDPSVQPGQVDDTRRAPVRSLVPKGSKRGVGERGVAATSDTDY